MSERSPYGIWLDEQARKIDAVAPVYCNLSCELHHADTSRCDLEGNCLEYAALNAYWDEIERAETPNER